MTIQIMSKYDTNGIGPSTVCVFSCIWSFSFLLEFIVSRIYGKLLE